jgi:GntR family transcriptional repressor for pyruvate dehydrogenase complex
VLPNPLSRKPSAEGLIDLLEARRTIEPPIAAVAATMQDEDGVRRLCEVLDEARSCLQSDPERLWVVNLDFHRALALASGNTVLSEVVDSIVLVHAGEQREILRLHGDESADFNEHEAITNAVLDGDAEAAYEATRVHLANVIETIRSRQE